jgi:hypothetical protein
MSLASLINHKYVRAQKTMTAPALLKLNFDYREAIIIADEWREVSNSLAEIETVSATCGSGG